MYFIILLFAILSVTVAVAPGDEEKFCFDRYGTPPHGPTLGILMDSYNYVNLLHDGQIADSIWVWSGIVSYHENKTWLSLNNRPEHCVNITNLITIVSAITFCMCDTHGMACG